METTRTLNNSKLQPFGTKAEADGREMLVDELNEDFIVPPSLNGRLASTEAKDQSVDVLPHKTLASLFHAQPSERDGESADKGKVGLEQQVKGYEWIELGVRRQVVGARAEEAERKTESAAAKETGGLFRSNRMQSPTADNVRSSAASSLRRGTAGPHVLLEGEYPAVDYPMDEDSNSKSATSESGEGVPAKRDSELQPGNQDVGRGLKQPGDGEADTSNFSHNLKSPGLQKRRPNGNSHSLSNQTPRHHLEASFSQSHSDYKQKTKRNSVPAELESELRHASIQQASWNTAERTPPDPQTLSEPELPTLSVHDKWLQVKTQRSASIPNITTRHELRPSSSGVRTLLQCRQNSPLEGLLERAKERVKERHAFENNQKLNIADSRTRYPPPPPSPSFSTPLSASLSDGDRDTEEEVEVELTRYRALTVSEGWKEQLVDGDEDYKRDRSVDAAFQLCSEDAETFFSPPSVLSLATA